MTESPENYPDFAEMLQRAKAYCSVLEGSAEHGKAMVEYAFNAGVVHQESLRSKLWGDIEALAKKVLASPGLTTRDVYPDEIDEDPVDPADPAPADGDLVRRLARVVRASWEERARQLEPGDDPWLSVARAVLAEMAPYLELETNLRGTIASLAALTRDLESTCRERAQALADCQGELDDANEKIAELNAEIERSGADNAHLVNVKHFVDVERPQMVRELEEAREELRLAGGGDAMQPVVDRIEQRRNVMPVGGREGTDLPQARAWATPQAEAKPLLGPHAEEVAELKRKVDRLERFAVAQTHSELLAIEAEILEARSRP